MDLWADGLLSPSDIWRPTFHQTFAIPISLSELLPPDKTSSDRRHWATVGIRHVLQRGTRKMHRCNRAFEKAV